MSTIVQFKTTDAGSVSPAITSQRDGPRRPCEVILFPGVRYERWTEAADPASDAKTSPVKAPLHARTKTRKLELAD